MKTKCGKCGAKFEYELEDAGQTVPCDCGAAVMLEAPEPAKPALQFCPGCSKNVEKQFWLAKKGLCAMCQQKEEGQKRDFQARMREENQRQARVDGAQNDREGPQYGALAMLAGVMSALGVVGMIIGGLAAITGLLMLTTAGGTAVEEKAQQASDTLVIVQGLSGLVSGLITMGMGQGLAALRAVAINSHHQRKVQEEIGVAVRKMAAKETAEQPA